jgi:hypothetical protein
MGLRRGGSRDAKGCAEAEWKDLLENEKPDDFEIAGFLKCFS